MSTEDTVARAEAVSHLDSHVPMALEGGTLYDMQGHAVGKTGPVAVHTAVFPEKGETAPEPEIAVSPLGPETPSIQELTEGQMFALDLNVTALAGEQHGAVVVLEPAKRQRRTSAEVAAGRLAKALERERAKQEKLGQSMADAITREQDKAALRAQRAAEREQAKLDRAAERVQVKLNARLAKIAEAEGGRVALPALVTRNGRVTPVSLQDAWAVVSMYLKHLFLDCETSGYPLGHQMYELKTVQLGGEEGAVVFDASDPGQAEVVSLALELAEKVSAHSASADAIPCVAAGLISWDEIWDKMHDSVLYLKLTDPHLSGSDASKLKEVAFDLLREYAVSPVAEKAKNELFKAMGCLVETDITTPVERNGWAQVSKNSAVMIRYAGSDVLDLAAVMRILPPLPVNDSVLQRERWFEAKCARVAFDGFGLDLPHIQEKIAEHEKAFAETQANVAVLSDGAILNPKSPDVIKYLVNGWPGIDFTVKDKTTKQMKDSAGKVVLARVKAQVEETDPLLFHLAGQILDHRHHSTVLSLLLRPLEHLCQYGDSRMRPTVYTINADTGRCSCVRPNGQQFSRQGGIRACVVADPGWVMCNADFQGCEIMVGGALSGDEQMIRAETEPFCHKCQRMTYLGDECSCGLKDGELAGHTGLHWLAAVETFGRDATKEHRYKSKAVIFRKMFGGAPDSDVAQRISDAFDTRVAPAYAQWDRDLRQAFRDGTLAYRDYATGTNVYEPMDGSRRGIYRTYSGRQIYVNAPHAFGNYAIQGTARELLVDGVIRWSSTPWGGLPLLPIHDELLLWVRREEFKAATAELKRAMETDVLSSPGFPVHIGADPELREFTYWPDSS